MWYIAHTTAGRELDAVDKCRKAIPEDIAARVFSPIWQHAKKYEGSWHLDDDILFAGYIFIESDSDSKTLEKLLWRMPNVVSPVRIGGDFNALNKEEEQYLRQLMDEYNCIAMSYGYIVDDQLMIYKGPLSGKSDMVKKIDRHKRIADIEVYLWHQPKRVRVGLEIIDKITKTDINEFEEFLINKNKSRITLDKYMRDIRRFQIFLSDNSYPLSQDTADKYIEILKNADYSISSINTIISCINTFCNFIGRNYIHCVNLKKSKTESTASDLLTVDEYNQLLKTAINNNDYRIAMLIQVLGNTDIRLNELQYLTTHSLEIGKITVIRNSEEYNIRIPDDLLDGLYEYIDHEDIITGVIFCTRKGTPLERSNVWRLIKKLAVDAGVNPDKVYPQNLKQQLGKKYYSIKY